MERASVARDGDSRTARDGAKWPLEWELQALAEQLQMKRSDYPSLRKNSGKLFVVGKIEICFIYS
jgi:hypothetical protein